MQPPNSDLIQQRAWQKNVFALKSETCTPQQKAEIYRSHFSHIQYAWANSEISERSAAYLHKKYAEKYAAIVDSDEAGTGLKNYVDQIMSLAKPQNESGKWQSALTVSNVLELESVQNMLKATEVSHKAPADLTRESKIVDDAASATGISIYAGPRYSHFVHKEHIQPSLKENISDSNLELAQKIKAVAKTNEGLSPSLFRPTSVAGCRAFSSFPTHSVKRKALCSTDEENQNMQETKQMGIQDAGHSWKSMDMQKASSSWKPMEIQEAGPRSKSMSIQEAGPSRKSKDIEEDRPSRKLMDIQGAGPSWKPMGSRPIATSFSSAEETGFKTAKEQLWVDQQKKYNNQPQQSTEPNVYGKGKKSLGAVRSRGLHGKFVPPIAKQGDGDDNADQKKACSYGGNDMSVPTDDRLKNIEPKMIELIMSEIMDRGPPLNWDDIAGLEFAKTTIKEIVVWPMLRPDIFTGLRGPPKGILLFGPPGTGKTLIGKCIACQSGATFFSISASSLTSKWVGEGEKMVRALFAVARCNQPAVIFIDEIDSLLSQRGEGEHESSRRIKTEFLVQLDGATTSSEDRILVVGATNRPQEIDEAARRRLVKRLYIPLPEASARRQIVVGLMSQEHSSLTNQQVESIVEQSDGFSGADMTQLCREAALGPIRSIQGMDIVTITPDQVRPIAYLDFQNALQVVRPSVSKKDLDLYETWNKTFGCGR